MVNLAIIATEVLANRISIDKVYRNEIIEEILMNSGYTSRALLDGLNDIALSAYYLAYLEVCEEEEEEEEERVSIKNTKFGEE